ncbi:hypothetical protein CDAR_540141 [Caerostris darwini]|uniref:Uncharacterized protein n=1 Tax=Caerostris darwini TaxID=1538125 RepID=A0AAV4WV10_9ARAC|nr:hypothetical protein CDAR_540141 [Caerostris darwini]
MSHPFYGKMWLWRWQLQQFLFRILRLPDHTGQHRSRIQMVLIPVCRIHSTGKCGSGGGSCSSSFSEYYVYPIIQGSTEVESLEGKVGKGLKIQRAAPKSDPNGINPRMSHPFYGQMWFWRWQLQQLLFRILRLPDHTGQHRSQIQMVLIPVCRIHSTGKCGSGGDSCSSSFSEYYVYPIIQGSTEVESLEGKVGKVLKIQKVLIPACRMHSTGKCGSGGGSCSSSFSEYYVYPIIQGSTEVRSKWY